jgi:hypothetical protein
MNRILIILLMALCLGQICSSQSDKGKQELFTSYYGVTTPSGKADIPNKTCQAIITEADEIMFPDKRATLAKRDLYIASLNLRTCATSELARSDRDLAVGLYGELVSERERRERARK